MMIAASLRPVAVRTAGLADLRHRQEGRAPCSAPAGGRRAPRSSDVSVPAPTAAARRQHSRRGPPPARAEGGAAQTAAALLQTAQTVPDQVVWHQATVVENREASADGSVRTLLLSVEDHVNFLEGRKVRHVQENRRWIDDYRVPGQFVAARYCADGTSTEGCSAGSLRVAQRLLCLASSPYEARRDSAMLDASLVELLVSRNGDGDERVLAELGPGAMIDVSRVAGEGFASLFNPKDINLMACLEGGHPLLVVAAGVRGIAPVRAALSWTPVLAHAGSCRVAVFFLTESQASAPYLVEWDTWREAGAQVHPLYVAEAAAAAGGNGGAAGASAEALLERELFGGEGGLAGVLGGAHAAKEAAVLFSGLGGELAASLQRRLTQQGVASERILVCDLGAAVSTVEAAATVKVPTNLNTIPHARETRKWFYSDLTSAVMRALEAGETRVIARSTFPELNTEFDVYRIGTLLEAVREVATALAGQGKRVRVCVQQPLGQGVFAGTPLSLNGVSRILRQMDWGACADQITFGSVTAEDVNDEADVFVLIAPQNIVGYSILPFLQEMTAAAGAAGKPMILINPKLGDIQSAGGVMSIRGRQERMDFVDTYTIAYHFRLLYKGVTMYPIMGALRHSYGGPWEVFRRVQLAPGEEDYRLIGSFEQEPKPPAITDAFRAAWAAQQA